MKFTNKKGKIRLYDGAGTPYYLEIDFDAGDFSGPMGAPKLEEILVLNRGNTDSDMHYINGPDDPLMEPVQISFTAQVLDLTQIGYLLSSAAAVV